MICTNKAVLMVGWLAAVHLMLRVTLPLPMALTSSIGYGLAGLGYEFLHFMAHTRVRFRRHSFLDQVQSHHRRHHVVDCRYWFGFSIPAIDILFGTHPSVRDVQRRQRQEKQ